MPQWVSKEAGLIMTKIVKAPEKHQDVRKFRTLLYFCTSMNKQQDAPLPGHSIVEKGGKRMIFDRFRRRYVPLTPEEWVRQVFLNWLVRERGFPPGLISVEHSLKYEQRWKRADAVVFNNTGQAVMLVECKAPSVSLDQSVLDQIARYNMAFSVPWLMVTNGTQRICCRFHAQTSQWEFSGELPHYAEL